MATTLTGDFFINPQGYLQEVGYSGTGTATVDGGSIETLDAVGNGSGLYLTAGGYGGGHGTVTLTGAGSAVNWVGNGDGNSGFQVGVGGGTGFANLNSGASITMSESLNTVNAYIGYQVGRDSGVGEMNIDDASIARTGWGVYTNIGRDSGTGVVTLSNGGSDMLTGTQEAGASVGRGSGGDGTLNILSGSQMVVHSGNGLATDGSLFAGSYFNVGRDDGTGELNVDASDFTVSSDVGNAGLQLGRGGTTSEGLMNVTNGGEVTISSSVDEAYLNLGRTTGATASINLVDSSFTLSAIGGGLEGDAFLNVARDGSTATFNADNSDVIVEADAFATFRVGMEFEAPGAVGTATFENGSTLSILGDGSALSVSYTANSTGTLNVLSGSTITIEKNSVDPEIFGVFRVGHLQGSNGSATIDGAGSAIISDVFSIGSYDEAFSGNGHLTISDGGLLNAGRGGLVGGGGELVLDNGTIDVGASEGGFRIFDGIVTAAAGSINLIYGAFEQDQNSHVKFQIDATGVMGQIIMSGDMASATNTSLQTIDAIGGYQFTAGEQHKYFEVTTGLIASEFDPASNFSVTGQSEAFSYFTQIVFTELGVEDNWELFFNALSDGDGSNQMALDLGAHGASGISFVYDFDTEFGTGSDGADIFRAWNVDEFVGTAANDDFVITGSGSATLIGAGGNDALSGGDGVLDTAVYFGASSEYDVTFDGIEYDVSHLSGSGIDGSDALVGC